MNTNFAGLIDANGNPVKLTVGDRFNIRRPDNLVSFGFNGSKANDCGGNVAYSHGLKMTADKDSKHFNHAGVKRLDSKRWSMVLADVLAIAGIQCQLDSDEGTYIKYEVVPDFVEGFRGLVDSKGNKIKLGVGDNFGVRKSDNLVTFGLNPFEHKNSGSNTAYAQGLSMTCNGDDRLFDIAGVQALRNKLWGMLLVDILAIAGIQAQQFKETDTYVNFEIISVDYANHNPGLNPSSPRFSKDPVEQRSGDFDLFKFINPMMLNRCRLSHGSFHQGFVHCGRCRRYRGI